LLLVGILLVRASDFAAWYSSEQVRGKWPSQRSSTKVRPGRPTKQTGKIRNAIIALARDGKWTGEMGVTKLRRLLIALGRSDVPSVDTLTRIVDRLHSETGDPALFRKGRARRKRTRAIDLSSPSQFESKPAQDVGPARPTHMVG
jgi:hypothetical protein